jgi:hypothetical protein
MISEIIPDLGNGLSGLKGVFDKISEQMGFALSSGEYEGIIQRRLSIFWIQIWKYSNLRSNF